MKTMKFTSAIAFAALLVSGTAFAHPLGNFSLNQYSLIDLRGEVPVIHWQIDIAEIPSYREMDLLDTNLDGEASEAEMEAYLDARVPVWFENFVFLREGEPVQLMLLETRLNLLKGTGDEPVFQAELTMRADGFDWPPADEPSVLEFRSVNHENAQGYREGFIELGGRFPIEIGPWDEGDYKYQQAVAVDEDDNALFQSFYNVFRMELGPDATGPQDVEHAPDFEWTATAQFEDRPTEIIASHEESYEPGKIVHTYVPPAPKEEEKPKTLADYQTEPMPERITTPVAVAKPKNAPANETNAPVNESVVFVSPIFILGIAFALGAALLAVIAIVRALWGGSRDKD